jgi:hypothetical protein
MHLFLQIAQASLLYDMRHRPSTQWEETPRLSLGRISSPQDLKGNRGHTERPTSKTVSRARRQLRRPYPLASRI